MEATQFPSSQIQLQSTINNNNTQSVLSREPINQILAFSSETNKNDYHNHTIMSKDRTVNVVSSSCHSTKDQSSQPFLDSGRQDQVMILCRNDSSGSERLKRHREEVAGRVSVPDKWSQESLLKEWMDYSTFDKLLAPKGIATARAALVAEGRRANSSSHQTRFWVGNRFLNY